MFANNVAIAVGRMRVGILALVVIASYFAAGVWATPATCSGAEAEEDTPPFPCLLQHGCVCNHTGTIVRNLYDGQYYAPCASCSEGWSGPLCNQLDTPCMNGGSTSSSSAANNSGAPCVCPLAWSGHSCEDVECPNSIGGHGPFHVAAPDATTHRCDGSCLTGWDGVQCGLCEASSSCAPYSGTQGVCDASLIARGPTKHLECDVSNAKFLKLLGHNVEGRVTMDCNSGRGSTVPFATSSNAGECSVAFFRIEENASYVDPFFFCTARNCSMEVTVEKDESGKQVDLSSSTTFEAMRKLGQTALLAECALLAVLGQLAKVLPKKLVGRALLLTTAILVLTFGLYVMTMVGMIDNSRAPLRSIVAYRCDAARCVCAPDPPAQYTPICSQSVLGTHILPIIANGMDVTCHTDDNKCVFSPRDVPTRVDLACRASECVDTEVYPDAPVVSSGGSTTSNSQEKNLMVLAIAVGCIAAGAVALHLHVTFQRTWSSAREFVDLFLTEAALLRPASLSVHHHHHHRPPGSVTHEEVFRDAAIATPRGPSSSSAPFDSELQVHNRPVTGDTTDDEQDGSDDNSSTTTTASDTTAINATPHDMHTRMQHAIAAIASPTLQVYQPLSPGDEDSDDGADVDGGGGSRQQLHASDSPLRRAGEHSQSRQLHRRDIHGVMSAPISLQLRRLSYQLRPPSCGQGVTSAMQKLCASTTSLGDFAPRPPRATTVGIVEDGNDIDGANVDALGQQVKQILNEVTFTVSSGEVLALMGPSGAGKTTLLDLLATRLKSGDVSGSIDINGVPMSTEAHKQQYRAMLGYVSQEDTLLPSLTVRETVYYAAKLKLPTSFSETIIDHIVTSVLLSLRLDRCSDTLVGDGSAIRGVSGGERRRVSIAVELVANPRILFLDEPTSGLDAVSARVVMEAVAQLARAPPMQQYAPHFFAFAPIVVFSIHQPSRDIYELFDKVLLLSRGVAVYYGVAAEAVPYLAERLLRSPRVPTSPSRPSIAADGSDETDALFPVDPVTQRRRFTSPPHENPADVLMKLEDRIDEQLRDDLRAERAVIGLATGDGYLSVTPGRDKDVGKQVLALTIASRKYYPNVWQQMRLLSLRSLSALLGSFELIVCHALVTCVVGVLMCTLYEHEALDLPGSLNRAGSITFLLLVVAFVSLSGLDPLLSERKLLVVERENGYYGTLPYLLTKLLVDVLPLRIISVGVLGAVIYFPMGLRTDDAEHFLWFVALLCLFSVCMSFMTFAVGIVLGSFGPAALTSAVVILWNFVFGGLLVQADTIPYVLAPFRRISPFFLTFEALLVNELNGQLCTFAPTDATGRPSATSIPLLCVQYLENLGLHPSRFAGDVALLGLMTLLLLVILYALLRGIKTVR